MDALGDNSVTIADGMVEFLGNTSRIDPNSWSIQTTCPSTVNVNFRARFRHRFLEEGAPVTDAVKKEYAYISAKNTIGSMCALIRKRMNERNMSNVALATQLSLSEDETFCM